MISGDNGANRALFTFKDAAQVPITAVPKGQFSLSGPAEKLDADHWPVRGDLAHISLVGRVFVPHYAVPMPHHVLETTDLRRAAKPDGDVLCTVNIGANFDVLDISGDWCWGQMGTSGYVGYIPQNALKPA